MSRNRVDHELERAAAEIRSRHLAEDESGQIAARVWERLAGRAGEPSGEAELGAIHGCADYQALIAPFLDGGLAPSRALLLEEHARHCVPCRRALKTARAGAAPATPADAERGRRPRPALLRRAAAALLAVGAAAAGYLLWSAAPAPPYGAVVETTGGGLYLAATLEPVPAGSELALGQSVRSGPGASAFLRLADGSQVEVRGRSQLAVESGRRGTTIQVDRGGVLVEAAEQGRGRLYVATDDCLVSVRGTIFTVSHGTRGSRVAVIEGEVQVDWSGQERTLYAGDRATTYASLAPPGGFASEFAWSANVDTYLELLREVSELRQALARDLPRPGLRYSSRLLDLAPDDIAFFAALPNLADTLAAANRIVQERLAESPVLSEWWSSRSGGAEQFGEVAATLAEAGGFLGDEIAVFARVAAAGEMAGPVVLAELTDPEGMRDFLARQVASHGGEAELVFFDPARPLVDEIGDSGESMVVWLGGDTLIAAPRAVWVAETVGRVQAGGGGPAPGGFKRALAEVYRGGAEILVGADLRRITAAATTLDTAESAAIAERTGLLEARHLILQQKRLDGRVHNDAVLDFDGPRRGLAGWLAEPAPMGSLAYVSPDAKLAAAAIVVEPVRILDELLAVASAEEPEAAAELARVDAELGLSLRDDVAAALGGEVALALDGPLVPEPAWKIIAEVYDPPKLVWAASRIVAAANDARAREGLSPLAWVEEKSGGRTYYGVVGESSDHRELWLAFDEGYVVVAPARAHIDRAIRFRESGYTLDGSSRFAQLMPADGRENFSALVYQNAGDLVGALAERIAAAELTPEQRAALESLRGQSEPTLAYAYGEQTRVVFATRSAGDLLAAGLPGLLGLGALQ